MMTPLTHTRKVAEVDRILPIHLQRFSFHAAERKRNGAQVSNLVTPPGGPAIGQTYPPLDFQPAPAQRKAPMIALLTYSSPGGLRSRRLSANPQFGRLTAPPIPNPASPYPGNLPAWHPTLHPLAPGMKISIHRGLCSSRFTQISSSTCTGNRQNRPGIAPWPSLPKVRSLFW